MSPKEIAAHYQAKVFDTQEAAKVAGFLLTEKMSPRNVWNKASAAQALVMKLADKKEKGEGLNHPRCPIFDFGIFHIFFLFLCQKHISLTRTN